MASIGTQIELYDRVSTPINNIMNAVNRTVTAYESLHAASSNAIGDSSFDSTRASVEATNDSVDRLETNIRQSENAQEQFNREVQNGSGAMNGLTNQVIGLVAAYASFQSIGTLVGLSDSMTQTTARLNLMNDKLQTTEELQEKIFESAQRSRSSYLDTAAAISKMGLNAGNAFSSNAELIAFMEQVNKQFVIGGASATEQANATMQLTQAMAAGALRGDELNSILEGAPGIARAIETSMGWAAGSIKSYAEEGLVSATVVKNALLSATDDVNAQFESMPMTWAQVWTGVMNELLLIGQPLLEFISMLAQNWSILEPIVLGAAIVLGAYVAVLGVYCGLKAAAAIAESVHAAAAALATGATFVETAAQYGLNAALMACPLTWIILLIIVLIAILYAAVAALNKFAGTSVSATGIIAGAFMVALAFIGNLFVGFGNLVIDIVAIIWNYIAGFAEFFANVFNDPIGSIVRLFASMADLVLGILEGIASAIDTLFGSNLAGAVSGWRSDLQSMVTDLVGEAEIKVPRMDASSMHLDRFEYGAAFDVGYKFGEGIGNSFSKLNPTSAFDTSSIPKLNPTSAFDTSSIPSNIADIAENTGAIKDSVEISEEDMKYLRDAAERETINRFTTAEIKIDMGGVNNNISSNMDIDGVVDYLVTGVNEAMEKAAEGVHE